MPCSERHLTPLHCFTACLTEATRSRISQAPRPDPVRSASSRCLKKSGCCNIASCSATPSKVTNNQILNQQTHLSKLFHLLPLDSRLTEGQLEFPNEAEFHNKSHQKQLLHSKITAKISDGAASYVRRGEMCASWTVTGRKQVERLMQSILP
jgi:hypothetical protein